MAKCRDLLATAEDHIRKLEADLRACDRAVAAASAPDQSMRRARTSSGVAFGIAFLQLALPLVGVTVSLLPGALLLLVSAACAAYAVWIFAADSKSVRGYRVLGVAVPFSAAIGLLIHQWLLLQSDTDALRVSFAPVWQPKLTPGDLVDGVQWETGMSYSEVTLEVTRDLAITDVDLIVTLDAHTTAASVLRNAPIMLHPHNAPDVEIRNRFGKDMPPGTPMPMITNGGYSVHLDRMLLNFPVTFILFTPPAHTDVDPNGNRTYYPERPGVLRVTGRYRVTHSGIEHDVPVDFLAKQTDPLAQLADVPPTTK